MLHVVFFFFLIRKHQLSFIMKLNYNKEYNQQRIQLNTIVLDQVRDHGRISPFPYLRFFSSSGLLS